MMNSNGHTEQRKRSIVDFGTLESELTAEAKKIPTMAERGKVGADGGLEQYDLAMRAMEAMREVVHKDKRELEASIAEREDDLRNIAEALGVIRDKSNLIRAQIDRAGAVSASIRNAVSQCLKAINE